MFFLLRDVGRITDQHVQGWYLGYSRQRVLQEEVHLGSKPPGILFCNMQGVGADVTGINRCLRNFQCERDGYAATAGPYIEDSRKQIFLLKYSLYKQFGLRPGNEYAGVNFKCASKKISFPQDVLNGLLAVDALKNGLERRHRGRDVGCQHDVLFCDAQLFFEQEEDDALYLLLAFVQVNLMNQFSKKGFGIGHALADLCNVSKKTMTPDEIFMLRAMELARLGKGYVSPNPLVGCVIVHDGTVIGEGWHQRFGEAHAEVNAVASVKDKMLLKESTVYVNLEPCAHVGKTPPCADMLVGERVKKVVVANVDSNPLVAGEGLKRLRQAGIEVETGVLEKEGRELNRRFFTFIEKRRPYIILKWAQTADGFIAHENFESRWISNAYARQLVHKWRSEEDAVLVGTKTAAHDNPTLNVRDWTGRNPARIVLDRFLRLSRSLHLFDQNQKTICYNVLRHEEHHNLSLVRLDENGFIAQVVNDLHRRGIQSVIVEGGTSTHKLFLDADLCDETRVFTSPRSFERGIPAQRIIGKLVSSENILTDTLHIYRYGQD